MKVITPGVSFYADRVQKGDPFTLVRYGEGDLRLAVPSLVAKGDDPKTRGLREIKANARLWAKPDARSAFREAMATPYRHPCYFPAIWHLQHMKRSHRLDRIEGWFDDVGLGDVEWHDGSVWRVAVEKQRMGEMMDAIRSSPLPIVVVAPNRMDSIQKRLPVAKFIPSPVPCGLDHVPTLMKKVLGVGEPALIIVCAAAAGKVLIHRLFPEIGEHSFIIDFGASLDGMCGNRVRGYHGPKSLTDAAVEKNWGKVKRIEKAEGELPITVTHYGAKFYAREIREGRPFSLVRYGAGEWYRIVPDLPEWRKRTGPNWQVPSKLWTIWEHSWSAPVLQAGMAGAHHHPRYWTAIWQIEGLSRKGHLEGVMDFIVETGHGDREWHHGGVWQKAVKGDGMRVVVDALKGQSLPLVLIGPHHLAPLTELLPIHTHIPTDLALSPVRDLPFLREKVFNCPRPAIYMFSASGIGKTITQHLFPVLGEESFMIDFGATWDGYCGMVSRGYHQRITKKEIEATFGGEG